MGYDPKLCFTELSPHPFDSHHDIVERYSAVDLRIEVMDGVDFL